MTIVEYILDPQDEPRSYHPKTIPSYITDGGHFFNPDGSEQMIAMIPDGDVPDDATTFTLEELQTRQRAIHAEYPITTCHNVADHPDKRNLTDDEVNALVKEWVDARS